MQHVFSEETETETDIDKRLTAVVQRDLLLSAFLSLCEDDMLPSNLRSPNILCWICIVYWLVCVYKQTRVNIPGRVSDCSVYRYHTAPPPLLPPPAQSIEKKKPFPTGLR
jgi:hypothetical protein